MSNYPPANYPNPYQTPTVIIKPSANRNVMKWMIAITAILFGLLLGLIVLLLIGSETGIVGLLVGMVCATIPVPIYVMLLLWIDRYESEPMWMLATAFFWGALVAVFGAFILNTAVSIGAAIATNSNAAAEFAGAVISAPIVEESLKAMVLFILFFWKKDEFDGVVDGIVYAGMVALGFAMTENIQYYGRGLISGGLVPTLIIRGIFAPFSHPLFTSMTGIGLGWSRQTNNTFIKWIAPVFGLGLAIALHATWNGSATIFGPIGFFAAYFLVMVPVFIATLVTVIFALRREGRVVREQLATYCQSGLIPPHEYERLCKVSGRMGASFNALTKGGFNTWRTRMQYNQMASELAFHRSRVSRGIMKSEQEAREREAAYVQLLQELRQRLDSQG